MNLMSSYDKEITFLCIHLLEIHEYFKYSNRNMQNHCTITEIAERELESI